MQAADAKNLEHSALLGELARPLVHDVNNFLNTLFLQMAIMDKELPEQFRSDWASIQSDGKRLVSLIREWQSHRSRPSGQSRTTELNQLIQEIADEWRWEDCPVKLTAITASEPLRITGSTWEIKRLLLLLLQTAVTALEVDGETNHTMEMRIEKVQGLIQVQILGAGPAISSLRWADFDDPPRDATGASPLMVAACKSLAYRLNANIRVEKKRLDDRYAMLIAFPGL